MQCTQSTRKGGLVVVAALVVIGGLCAQIPPKHPRNQQRHERYGCLAVLDAIYGENGDELWRRLNSRICRELNNFLVLLCSQMLVAQGSFFVAPNARYDCLSV